jgi:RNA recognition motif-containing protein
MFHAIFENHGRVQVRVRTNQKDPSKRIGYAKFINAEECDKAFEKYQGAKLDEHSLIVRRAFAFVTMDGKPQ